MNAYDFDNTIYKGDSSVNLILYTLKKKPFLMIKYILKTIPIGIKFIFKQAKLIEVKEILFSFILEIKDLDKYLDLFVDKHMKKIKSWYLNVKKQDDIIISASYFLWIKKFCDKLKIKNVIATDIDLKTGKIIEGNCNGKVKLVKFSKKYPNKIIKKAYSDSPKDIPLLEMAKEGFVVKGDKVFKYYKGYKF